VSIIVGADTVDAREWAGQTECGSIIDSTDANSTVVHGFVGGKAIGQNGFGFGKETEDGGEE
jgi:hypothetical protein